MASTEAHKAASRASMAKRRLAEPHLNRQIQDARRHGWTPEERKDFEDSHHNRCGICGSTSPGSRVTAWSIDHDHQCCPQNKSCRKCRRGILCQSCNHGLGMFRDDVELLEAAIIYLERTS